MVEPAVEGDRGRLGPQLAAYVDELLGAGIAGVVIADRPLDELIPLYRDPRSDMPVTQFSMKYAELSGLIKFDFLGLKTLTVLSTALKLMKARGHEIDLADLPFVSLEDDDAITGCAAGQL